MCDFQHYTPAQANAQLREMSDVIDGNWIQRRLTHARGEKARLARAMGIDQQKLSKVLNGKRQVQPGEIPGLLEYFQIRLPAPAPENASLSPLPPTQEEIGPLLDCIARGIENAEALRVNQAQLAFGLLQGDIIAVDLDSVNPTNGNLVAMKAAGTDAKPLIARYVSGTLVYSDPSWPPEPLEDSGRILGVIVGSARAPRLIP